MKHFFKTFLCIMLSLIIVFALISCTTKIKKTTFIKIFEDIKPQFELDIVGNYNYFYDSFTKQINLDTQLIYISNEDYFLFSCFNDGNNSTITATKNTNAYKSSVNYIKESLNYTLGKAKDTNFYAAKNFTTKSRVGNKKEETINLEKNTLNGDTQFLERYKSDLQYFDAYGQADVLIQKWKGKNLKDLQSTDLNGTIYKKGKTYILKNTTETTIKNLRAKLKFTMKFTKHNLTFLEIITNIYDKNNNLCYQNWDKLTFYYKTDRAIMPFNLDEYKNID